MSNENEVAIALPTDAQDRARLLSMATDLRARQAPIMGSLRGTLTGIHIRDRLATLADWIESEAAKI